MYSKVPFASWVPKPIVLILNFFIVFSLLCVAGVYSGNSSDISGSLGIYGEFLGVAKNATTIGMCLSIFLLVRFKSRFRSKELMTGSAIAMAALLYVIGVTENPYLVIVCSLLIGFCKMFPMLEMVTPLMGVLGKGNKGVFYGIFYPLAIGFTQIYTYYFSQLVFVGSYQSIYFLMSGVMLIFAIISLVFQHNQRFSHKYPLYQIDWLSIGMFGASAMCFNFFLTFMRQQGWFTSPYIVGAFFVGVLLLILTIYRQPFVKPKRRLFYFDVVYKNHNVRHGIILFLFLGIFLSTASAYSQYFVGVLGYNNVVNAKLNLWMIPGLLIAGVYAYFSFKKQWKIKYFILVGFISIFLHVLSIYFIIQPQMDIYYLGYTMIFKGMGMAMLFIGIWFYASSNVPIHVMTGVMSMMIMIRTFLSLSIGSTIVSWASYQAQWQSISDMSIYLDWGDAMIGSVNVKNISINAIMSSAKIVLGTVCWMIIPVMIIIFSHHYGVFNYRRAVFFRKLINGNSIKGYKFRVK